VLVVVAVIVVVVVVVLVVVALVVVVVVVVIVVVVVVVVVVPIVSHIRLQSNIETHLLLEKILCRYFTCIDAGLYASCCL